MESEWEKEIRELLESFTLESLDELLKEITEAPIFTDWEKVSKPLRTRRKKKAF